MVLSRFCTEISRHLLTFKEHLLTTSSESVYGKPLRLPKKFFKSSTSASDKDPTNLLHRLQNIFTRLQPIPCTPSVFIYKELKNCKFVFLHEGGILRALQPPYSGPHEVLERSDKTMILKIKGKPTKVSIDRVKPAFIFNEHPELSTSTVDTSASSSLSADPPSSPPAFHQRSFRRVRFNLSPPTP